MALSPTSPGFIQPHPFVCFWPRWICKVYAGLRGQGTSPSGGNEMKSALGINQSPAGEVVQSFVDPEDQASGRLRNLKTFIAEVGGNFSLKYDMVTAYGLQSLSMESMMNLSQRLLDAWRKGSKTLFVWWLQIQEKRRSTVPFSVRQLRGSRDARFRKVIPSHLAHPLVLLCRVFCFSWHMHRNTLPALRPTALLMLQFVEVAVSPMNFNPVFSELKQRCTF